MRLVFVQHIANHATNLSIVCSSIRTDSGEAGDVRISSAPEIVFPSDTAGRIQMGEDR